jgi:hypothetical protein
LPSRSRSRVLRTAAAVPGTSEETAATLLSEATVGIELERAGTDDAVALHAAVRQALLIWRRVVVALPADAHDFARACRAIAHELRPGEEAIELRVAVSIESGPVLHIGPTASGDPRVVTVTNSGWLMQLYAAATGATGGVLRIPRRGTENAIAAAGAAALGIGELFVRMFVAIRPAAALELSLFDYNCGPFGTGDPGPALPARLMFNGIVVGAGTVSAGFALAVSPIELRGKSWVVDHDAAWAENFGPHMLVSTVTNGIAKAKLLRDRLVADHPELDVTAKTERFRLFRYRIGKDIPPPDVVITGLDRARPRQEVQRLWAPLHIDMATKDGVQVQVLVRTNPGRGMCMIKKFPIGDEPAEEAELAARTGLSIDALAEDLGAITEEDVRRAPPERRAVLEAARQRGERRCNLITAADLGIGDGRGDDYIGSAPFSALLGGVFAAGELIKARGLDLDRDGMLAMYHFVSRNVYVERTKCGDVCECAAINRQVGSEGGRER